MAVVIEEATLMENILHYGLFAGAIFQLICIFAVVLIPKSSDEQSEEAAPSGTPQPGSQAVRPVDSSRRGKKERKKHR